MKIESNTEKDISVSDNSGINAANNSSSSAQTAQTADFEKCIKDLDENKKLVTEQNKLKGLLTAQKKSEKSEAPEDLKKFGEKDKFSFKNNKIDNLNHFIHSRDFLKIHDDSTKTNQYSLKKKDIEFFRTCLENPSITLNTQNLKAAVAVQNQNGQVSYKSLDVSKSLFDLIEHSFKAQKPVRLDFDGNSSVILKMNTDGKLIAEFMSNDKAMEYILKSSIPGLKSKMDAEDIPYDKISYKDNSNSKNNDKRQNKGGNQ